LPAWTSCFAPALRRGEEALFPGPDICTRGCIPCEITGLFFTLPFRLFIFWSSGLLILKGAIRCESNRFLITLVLYFMRVLRIKCVRNGHQNWKSEYYYNFIVVLRALKVRATVALVRRPSWVLWAREGFCCYTNRYYSMFL